MECKVLLSFDSNGSDSLLAYKFDKESVNDVIAKMIMVHEYPFMMVEHKWFRIFANMLNPKFKPMGAPCYSRPCDEVVCGREE